MISFDTREVTVILRISFDEFAIICNKASLCHRLFTESIQLLYYHTPLTLLHSGRPKLYAILVFLSAVGLKSSVSKLFLLETLLFEMAIRWHVLLNGI